MIPRKQRIIAEDIVKIIKIGKNVNSPYFYTKFIENNLAFPRFSIVISKKTSILSVRRHLLKRRVSDIIEKYFLDRKSGFDCTVFSKEGAEKLDYEQIKEEILKLLNYIK